MADLGPIAEATSLAHLGEFLLARGGGGDPVTARLELEAWTYSLNDEPLRTRLQANVSALRQAIAAALSGLAAQGRATLHAEPMACAAVIEGFAMGLVARSALDTRARNLGDEMRLLLESLAGIETGKPSP